MLGHACLFEFLVKGSVDGGGFLADEFGFLNGELFVGFDFDFSRFFRGFLADEGGHFAEFGGDLEGGGETGLVVSRKTGWVGGVLERTRATLKGVPGRRTLREP